MVWYSVFGGFIFWVSLILAIILFATYRKFHLVMYMVSISLYVFTMGYLIGVFNLHKFGILLVLSFSAVLFMILGYYLSKVLSLKDSKATGSNRAREK
jgi:hypothetical protein